MEIKSYSELYLTDVSENIGAMLEYANKYGYPIETFWLCFINSTVAKQIEKGNPKYLSGYSGKELIDAILKEKSIKKINSVNNKETLSFDMYYWAGWAISQLQYNTNYSFYYINKYLPINRTLDLYYTLHEADISKFFDTVKTYFIKENNETNLKKIRMAAGLSQSKLSIISGVDLRSIQMYEQKRNDINKAQVETLVRISNLLSCRIEDLLEVK